MDYPEEHQDGVVELLRDLAALDKSAKVRLLFLSRRKIADWQDAIHLSKAQALVDMKEVHIGSLEETSGYKLFCTAQKKASEINKTTPLPLSEEAFAEWLSIAPENKRALFIIAMAVYSAIHPKEEIVSYKGRKIIKALVDRELERLEGIAKDRGIKDPYFFARLLAMAAIADNIPVSQVKELCREENLNLECPNNLDLQTELQNADLLPKQMIIAPKPDIVAALFVVTVLAQRPETAPEFIWHGLRNDLKGGLERLARLSYDSEVVLGHLEHRLSEWLSDALDGKGERCKLLDPFFSKKIHPVVLAKAGVAVYKTLLPLTENEERKAVLLNNLSLDLSSLGNRQAALNATFKAVEIYERLAESNPEAFEPNLAMSLNNLGNRYSNVGDRQKALEAAKRALEIRERLAKSNPEAFEPYLAINLGVLGRIYIKQGSFNDAQEFFERAIKTLKRLFLKHPQVHAKVMSGLIRDYGKACEKTEINPDMELLEPIMKELEKMKGS